jgi:hypothetical protein
LRDYFVTKVASINWDVREHFFWHEIFFN